MAGVEADEVGSDIVTHVCSYPDQNMGIQKMAISLVTAGQNGLTFGHNLPWGCPSCRWCHCIGICITALLQCHQHQHLHSEGSSGQQKD